jgi:hypothetical protein
VFEVIDHGSDSSGMDTIPGQEVRASPSNHIPAVTMFGVIDLRENNDNVVGSSVLQETRSLGDKHRALAVGLDAAMQEDMGSAAALFAVVWDIQKHLVIETMFSTVVVRFLGSDDELTMLGPVVGAVLEIVVGESQEFSSSIVASHVLRKQEGNGGVELVGSLSDRWHDMRSLIILDQNLHAQTLEVLWPHSNLLVGTLIFRSSVEVPFLALKGRVSSRSSRSKALTPIAYLLERIWESWLFVLDQRHEAAE